MPGKRDLANVVCLWCLFFLAVSLLFVACDRAGEKQPVSTPAQQEQVKTNHISSSLQNFSDDVTTPEDIIEEFGPFSRTNKRLRIGVVVKSLGNPYFQELLLGIRQRAQELGVYVDIQGSASESDREGQRVIMDEMIAKAYDALILCPQSMDNLQPSAEMARQKNILVINLDQALMAGVDYYIGPDHSQSGILVAEYLKRAFPAGADYAIILGHPGNREQELMARSLVSGLGEGAFSLATEEFAYNDLHLAYLAAETILDEYPRVRAIFCTSDLMALGAVKSVFHKGRERQVAIIGRDGIHLALEHLSRGEMSATITVHPYELGQNGVEITARILNGQNIAKRVITPQGIIPGMLVGGRNLGTSP